MSKELLISSTILETKLAILEDDQMAEIFIERAKDQGILGNIYKGKVTRVLPGMQAAFVNIGLDRDAFLYVSDFFEDYEEYEALFSAEDEYEELLRTEADRIPAEEGRRRGRRGKPAPLPEPRPARGPIEDPVVETTHLEVEQERGEVGQILPEQLDFSAPTLEEPQIPREGESRENDLWILPDRLDTRIEYEPKEDSDADLPDQDVHLESNPDLHHLATRNHRSKRRKFEERTSIGDLLREGQEILVQVAKEPIGKKGARITSHVALPGRYVVFMPTVEHVGVSRRITTARERERLRNLILSLRGDSGRGGFITRTVSEGKTEEDFRRDMVYLTRLWEDIRTKAEKVSAPALIYSEPNLVNRVIRDYFSEEFRAVRVDDEHEYERIVDFVNRFNPDLVGRVRLYNKRKPLFDEYGVSAEIERALRPKIWLKNGGYIVINQTEALVAIDVNTGKFVGKTDSLEDTITRTNLDAVKEVVRQIRLRDLGGIIVIDFIDMDERKNRQRVMEALQQELSKDKSPSRILQFNEFGLVAITRKRVKQSLERILYQSCIFCNGTGMTKSIRTVCYSIYEEVRKMAPHLSKGTEILIRCHPEIGKALRNTEREVIKEIEEMTGKVVSVKPDPLMHIERFDLVET